jgi:hypothetical protein
MAALARARQIAADAVRGWGSLPALPSVPAHRTLNRTAGAQGAGEHSNLDGPWSKVPPAQSSATPAAQQQSQLQLARANLAAQVTTTRVCTPSARAPSVTHKKEGGGGCCGSRTS